MTDLDRFREEWKEEVAARRRRQNGNNQAPGSQVIKADAFKAERPKHVFINRDLTETDNMALDAFERAVDCEHIGKMTDAVANYREAFRLNEKVDKLYREKYYKNIKPALQRPQVARRHERQPSTGKPDSEKIIDMLRRMDLSQPVAECPEDQGECLLLTMLPDELLSYIMRLVAIRDMSSFVRLMYTCKRLALIGHTGEQIWRSVCYRAFAHQHYDEGVSCADGSDPDDLEAAATSTFGNSWRRMYYERPRIRFNGVYISTCNYIRQGVSDTWYAPVHMVTYYRYLRFYKDGTCISLLTSSEPADVVPVFNRSVVGSERRQDNTIVYSRDDGTVLTRPKYIINGSWKFQDLDGSLLVETEGSVDRFLFYMKFTIASSGHHRHNKLKWVNFWSVNKLTQNEADFTLRHDKAYYFVRSKY